MLVQLPITIPSFRFFVTTTNFWQWIVLAGIVQVCLCLLLVGPATTLINSDTLISIETRSWLLLLTWIAIQTQTGCDPDN